MSYVAITPNRLRKIEAAGRAIFGHLGSASPYGPGRPGGRRSPRPWLQKKMKGGMIARYDDPFLRPQMLEGRVWRQQEALEEKFFDAQDAALDAEETQEDMDRGLISKKQVVPLKKGKKRKDNTGEE